MKLKPAYRTALRVWLALLALLALTCGSAFAPLGAWNTVANFGIAAAKAALVGAFFMHLARASLHRTVVLAALFIFTLLLGLSLADFLTRSQEAVPWQDTQGSISSVH